MQDNDIDWLRNIPVYHNLNEVMAAMEKTLATFEEEYEEPWGGNLLLDHDRVLAGLVSYLNDHYISPLFQDVIYHILERYCGKPKEK